MVLRHGLGIFGNVTRDLRRLRARQHAQGVHPWATRYPCGVDGTHWESDGSTRGVPAMLA